MSIQRIPLDEFHEAMTLLRKHFDECFALAQNTSQPDVLAYVEKECIGNLSALREGIEIGTEDDEFDLGDHADLVCMYWYYYDLLHFCRDKAGYV